MAEVNELFDKITGEKSHFDPTKEKKYKPIVEGDYRGHITKMDTKVVDVKRDGNFRARLYKYEVTVAKEEEGYSGLRFRGALWRFLEPTEKDDFDSNSGGNKGYLRFCETLNVIAPTERKTVDGQDIEVKVLPNLTTRDMLCKPVIAAVFKGRPYKDKMGNERCYHDCKFVKKWADGKPIESESGGTLDEIPF